MRTAPITRKLVFGSLVLAILSCIPQHTWAEAWPCRCWKWVEKCSCHMDAGDFPSVMACDLSATFTGYNNAYLCCRNGKKDCYTITGTSNYLKAGDILNDCADRAACLKN